MIHNKRRLFDGESVLAQRTQRRLKEQAETSLYSFLRQAWLSMEGGDFVPNWHLEILSEMLEAVYEGQIKKLLINVPPRTGKTSLVSVAFPAWVWTQDPTKRFLYCSYARDVSLPPSLKCRRLIESPWYQSFWGHKVCLSKSQFSKRYFENTAGGSRLATSVGASITGLGGHFLVADDPNNPKDWESEAKIASTYEWWRDVWQSRLDSPTENAMILMQQRTSERDITALILNSDGAKMWTSVILPMCYEESRRCCVQVGQKVWQDPRQKEGELLFPARFPQKIIDERKGVMSAYGFAGQYQQRPAPQEGGIFQQKSFRIWPMTSLPRYHHLIASVDTALETKEESSYSACTTWGVFDHEGHMNVMLVGLFKAKLKGKELLERMRALAADFRDNGTRTLEPDGQHVPDVFVVEHKSAGFQVSDALEEMGVPVERVSPHKNKITRAKLIQHYLGEPDHADKGIVWIPGHEPDNYDRLYRISKVFLDDMLVFPNGASDDVADTMTQALLYLRDAGLLHNPRDAQAWGEDWH
jgi:phage terminase large subunit-like protein